jgi:RNA polymerase sigma-70 factor (ECF subfamily)
MSFPQSADELQRHAAWVRRVARALVRGPDRIDELEQETWLAAFSHPPRHTGDQRSWLGAVTRNVAKHLFRSEATRERHERDPARARAGAAGVPGSSPAAGEIVARAEIQQRVAAAVLALEEPYKSTLLARYFDELPPTEIARALDVSVETVKTRLKRGLAQLRERLDSLKGDAPTLEAALVPLCGPIAQIAVPASAKVIAAAATIVIGVSLVVMTNRRPAVSHANAASAAAPAVVASPVAPPSASAVPIAASGDPSPQQSVAPARTKESAPAPSSPPDDAPAHLTGRLLLPDGSGASGVALRVYGWESNQEAVLKYGLPTDWKPIDAVSQPDGSFSIEFTAPRAYQFTFDAKLDGYAAPAWRWAEIAPGSTKTLGDITLRRAGSIRGRIVDKKGDPILRTGWTVYADGPRCADGDGADTTRVYMAVDATTGGFLLENVPPGRIQIKANSRLTNWIEGPAVEVRSGETTDADIVYAGPDVAHRITVVLFARPFYIFESDAAEILLTGNGIEPRHATKIPFSSQSHSFDDVSDGQYTVEIRDPKFLPWRQDGVAVGSSINAKLKGNAQVRLHVVDAATGAEIPRYSLHVRFAGNTRPDTFELVKAGEPPPDGGLFDGMVPVDQTLLVEAPGCAACSLPLTPLPANQLTEVTARLTKGATISGVVLRSDGATPVANTHVHLEPKREGDAAKLGLHVITITGEEPSGAFAAETDSDGQFEFNCVPPGRYALHDEGDPPLEARIDDVEVREDTSRVADLELVLPPSGYLVGRLIVPDGATCAGLDVIAARPGETVEQKFARDVSRSRRDRQRMRGSIDAPAPLSLAPDGTFRLGPLPPGPTEVYLAFPPVRIPVGENGYMSSGSPIEFALTARIATNGMDPAKTTSEPITIVDGAETRADYDARAVFPGRLSVTITVDGAPAVGAIVEVRPGSSTKMTSVELSRVDRLAAGQLHADGSAILSSIPAGSVSVIVRGADQSWYWHAPHEIEIASGAESRAEFVIALVAGDLLVKDRATDLPMPSHFFDIGFGDCAADDLPFCVQSDASSRIHLRLQPGSYRMRDNDSLQRPDDAVSFDWTAQGPAADTIRIQKADASGSESRAEGNK